MYFISKFYYRYLRDNCQLHIEHRQVLFAQKMLIKQKEFSLHINYNIFLYLFI